MRVREIAVFTSLALAVAPALHAQSPTPAPAPTPYGTAAPYPYPYPPPAGAAPSPYPTYSPYGTAAPPPTYSPYATATPYGASPYATAAPPSGVPDAPKQLDYEEGQPIPPGYHLKEKVRLGPVIGGSVSFGVLWLTSLLGGAIATGLGDDDASDLWLPVIGPFITIAREKNSTSTSLLAVDGVGQAVGVGLLIWGISSPRTVLLRNDLAGIELHAVPMLGNKMAGLGLGTLF